MLSLRRIRGILPNAWSYAKIHVLVMAWFGYDVNIPDAVPIDEFGKKTSLLKVSNQLLVNIILISNKNYYMFEVEGVTLGIT